MAALRCGCLTSENKKPQIVPIQSGLGIPERTKRGLCPVSRKVLNRPRLRGLGQDFRILSADQGAQELFQIEQLKAFGFHRAGDEEQLKAHPMTASMIHQAMTSQLPFLSR